MIEDARSSGRWNVDEAIGKALEEAGENDVETMVGYLNEIKLFATRQEVEVRTMQEISGELDLRIDMHEMLDRFVRCGIMSQRTQRTIHTGMSTYEINPCLYWKS